MRPVVLLVCVCVCVCIDKRSMPAAKGQVTTCEKARFKAEADDSETWSLCVCSCPSVVLCVGEYATQPQAAQRYSLQW